MSLALILSIIFFGCSYRKRDFNDYPEFLGRWRTYKTYALYAYSGQLYYTIPGDSCYFEVELLKNAKYRLYNSEGQEIEKGKLILKEDIQISDKSNTKYYLNNDSAGFFYTASEMPRFVCLLKPEFGLKSKIAFSERNLNFKDQPRFFSLLLFNRAGMSENQIEITKGYFWTTGPYQKPSAYEVFSSYLRKI